MLKQDQKDNIDLFIESLEKMMDAKDEMWENEKYHNWRISENIRIVKYEPARLTLKEIVRKMIEAEKSS